MKIGINKGAELKKALIETNGIVKDILTNNLCDSSKIDYIELEKDVISFLPKGKEDDKPWKSRFRQKGKIGAVLNKIVDATPFEVKQFVDSIKSMHDNSDFTCKFLEGDEAVWAYTKDNLHWYETFVYSCMSHDSSRLRGRELYRVNPDKIKVAVAMKDGKVYARCLFAWNWKLTYPFHGHKTLCIGNRIYYGLKRAERALGEFLKEQSFPIYFQYWDGCGDGYLNNKIVYNSPSAKEELIYNENYERVSADRFSFKKEGDIIIGTC